MQGKFTNKAQEVLKRAQEAALKLGNKYVGTEHILLGLTLVSDSVAAKAAGKSGVTYHQVMDKIQSMTGHLCLLYSCGLYTTAKRVVEAVCRKLPYGYWLCRYRTYPHCPHSRK